MAASRRGIEIPLRIRPDSSVQRALRGVTAATRKATAQEMAEAKRSAMERMRIEAKADRAREQAVKRQLSMQMRVLAQEKTAKERAAKAAANAAKRQADREIKEAERSAKAQMRQADQLAKWKIRVQQNSLRIHERTERARVRDAQRAMKEIARAEEQSAQRRRMVLGTIGGGIVGGVMGAAGAAVGYAERAKGRLGVNDHGDTMQTAKQIHEGLIRQMIQTGRGDQVKGTITTIDEIAKRQTVPQAELASALNVAQARFSDFSGGMANLELFAQAARAMGESVDDVTAFALSQKQTFSLTDAEVADRVKEMFVQASSGSIEASDVAKTFAPSIATAAQNLGASGAEDANQINALVQVLGTSLKNPAEVATMLERMTSELKSKDTQDRLRKYGIDIADKKTGEIKVSPAEIIKMLVESPAMQSPVVRQEVFPELRAEAGVATAVTALTKDPELWSRLTAQATPEQGSGVIEKVNSALDDTPFSAVDRMNIEAQSVTLMNQGNFVGNQVQAAQTLHEAQVANPNASELVNPVLGTIAATGIGAGVGNLMTRGGASVIGKGAQVAKGAGGLLGKAGGGLARGAGGLARGAAGALAAMGPAGWIGLAGLATAGGIYGMFGEDIENWASGIPTSERRATRGVPGASAIKPVTATASADVAGATPAQVVDQIATQTAKQIDIGQGKITVEVLGPARVVGISQTDNFPTVDTGAMTSRM